MKRKFKYFIRIISMVLLFYMIFAINSFAAYGDFTDEEADDMTNQGIASQPVVTTDKSTNNYLKSIEVEGYVYTPSFDKQTLNYSIDGQTDANTIVIKAETEDERATISGVGELMLQSGENNLRIDVTAESGTVRTYFIKITKKVSDSNLRLKSLTVKSVDTDSLLTLSPSFNPEIYTYTADANSNTTSIDIQYTVNEGLNVEVEGNKDLKVGSNEILIKVKDNENNTTIYKILVNKKAIDSNSSKTDITSGMNKNYIIAAVVVVAILLLLVLLSRKKKNKKRRRTKH